MIRRIGYALRDLVGLGYYWYRTAGIRRQMDARVTRLPYGPSRRQYLLLAEPPDAEVADPRGWAVYLHGGGWTFGTPEAFLPAARPWLQAGYRVILPSYRRPPTVGLSTIVADCRRALAAAAVFARETGRPLRQPQLAGISAGGHLAATLALRPGWWTRAGWPAAPRRTLLFAAPLDLTLLRPRRVFRRWPAASPCQGPAAAEGSEWLLVHGHRDGFVNPEHSRRFADCLRRAGARVQEIPLPAGGHLTAGRWTYDDDSSLYRKVEAFIRLGVPAPPGPG